MKPHGFGKDPVVRIYPGPSPSMLGFPARAWRAGARNSTAASCHTVIQALAHGGGSRRWAGSNITITSTAGGGGGGHGRGSVGGKRRRLAKLREQLRQEQDTTAQVNTSAPANVDSNRTFAIETYGCQMNVSDSEVVR